MKVKDMVITAVFAAIICMVSPFTIPIGPIPLSLATLAIYIAASTLNWKFGTLSVVVYVAIGAIGLPVFSNFGAGIQRLVGPTGGFIIGYILCALVIGLILKKHSIKKWLYPVAMVIGTIVLYACGTAWFMFSLDYTLVSALMVTTVPFLIGDVIKIVLASVIAPRLRMILSNNETKRKKPPE